MTFLVTLHLRQHLILNTLAILRELIFKVLTARERNVLRRHLVELLRAHIMNPIDEIVLAVGTLEATVVERVARLHGYKSHHRATDE